MKFNKLPLIFTLPIILTSCGGEKPQEKNYFFVEAAESEKVTANVQFRSHTSSLLFKPFTYSDKYFAESNNKKLNVSLATASFGVALIPSFPEKNIQALEKFGYIDIETGYSNYDDGDFDRAMYMVGHKQIENRNMIVLSIRGSDYYKEWISNFNLGASGDHVGFNTVATDLVDVLKEYLNKYQLADNPKIWLTGYSRGGAIASLLGKKVYNDPFFMMKSGDNDLYVHTFEAPQMALFDNKEYPFIVNVVNHNDLITENFRFNMIRPGIDHFVNDYTDIKEVEAYCKDLESDKPLPYYFPKKLDIFSPSYIVDDYDSDMTYDELKDMLIKMVYMDTSSLPPSEDYLDVSTREKYMEKLEFSLAYLVDKGINLEERNIELIKDYFSEHKSDLIKYTSILSGNISSEDLYDLLKTVFDAGEISYTEEEIQTVSKQLPIAFSTMFAIAGTDNLKIVASAIGNATYFGYQHRCPLVYSYLNSIK